MPQVGPGEGAGPSQFGAVVGGHTAINCGLASQGRFLALPAVNAVRPSPLRRVRVSTAAIFTLERDPNPGRWDQRSRPADPGTAARCSPASKVVIRTVGDSITVIAKTH